MTKLDGTGAAAILVRSPTMFRAALAFQWRREARRS